MANQRKAPAPSARASYTQASTAAAAVNSRSGGRRSDDDEQPGMSNLSRLQVHLSRRSSARPRRVAPKKYVESEGRPSCPCCPQGLFVQQMRAMGTKKAIGCAQ